MVRQTWVEARFHQYLYYSTLAECVFPATVHQRKAVCDAVYIAMTQWDEYISTSRTSDFLREESCLRQGSDESIAWWTQSG